MRRLQRAVVWVLVATGCSNASDTRVKQRCACEASEKPPQQVFHAAVETTDPQGLLALLQRRQKLARKADRDAEAYLPGFDSYLRGIVSSYCSPCEWLSDYSKIEEMYPFDQLEGAVDAGCMFLTMPNGTRRYGALRPVECRPYESKPSQ